MKIYIPDKENYQCFVVQSEDVIRAYVQRPTNNSNVLYRDYYINADYIYREGYQQFSQYTTCLDNSIITNDFYYRLDLDKILIIFTIIVIFGFFIPFKIVSRLFKRGSL